MFANDATKVFLLFLEIEAKGTFSNLGVLLYKRLVSLHVTSIFAILTMVLFNIAIESLKWRTSLVKIYNIPCLEAFKSVLVGFSWGIFTPYRVGDYGGRLFCLSKEKRLEAGLLIVINGLSQNLNNLIFGSISLFFIIDTALPYLSISYLLILSLFIGGLMWLYFDMERLKNIVLKFIPTKSLKELFRYPFQDVVPNSLKYRLLFLSFLPLEFLLKVANLFV